MQETNSVKCSDIINSPKTNYNFQTTNLGFCILHLMEMSREKNP